jgi:hypothetical protein
MKLEGCQYDDGFVISADGHGYSIECEPFTALDGATEHRGTFVEGGPSQPAGFRRPATPVETELAFLLAAMDTRLFVVSNELDEIRGKLGALQGFDHRVDSTLDPSFRTTLLGALGGHGSVAVVSAMDRTGAWVTVKLLSRAVETVLVRVLLCKPGAPPTAFRVYSATFPRAVLDTFSAPDAILLKEAAALAGLQRDGARWSVQADIAHLGHAIVDVARFADCVRGALPPPKTRRPRKAAP